MGAVPAVYFEMALPCRGIPVATDKSSQVVPDRVHQDALPRGMIREHGYRVSFASTPDEVQAALRLRFEVFNLELGEGLEESYATGLDFDRFDPVCHHLLVIHEASATIVGTYRMQTSGMAAANHGFYSADEFTVADLPAQVVDDAVEVGRACVAKPYRNRHVLFLLWKGLALYLTHNRKRYLFGCCSLTSQDPVEGKRVMEHLRREGFMHPEFRVRPQPGWVCYEPDFRLDAAALAAKVDIPKLFGLYLRYGAKVCGDPALDRFFKTIDYFVLFDLADLDRESREMFFAAGTEA